MEPNQTLHDASVIPRRRRLGVGTAPTGVGQAFALLPLPRTQGRCRSQGHRHGPLIAEHQRGPRQGADDHSVLSRQRPLIAWRRSGRRGVVSSSEGPVGQQQPGTEEADDPARRLTVAGLAGHQPGIEHGVEEPRLVHQAFARLRITPLRIPGATLKTTRDAIVDATTLQGVPPPTATQIERDALLRQPPLETHHQIETDEVGKKEYGRPASGRFDRAFIACEQGRDRRGEQRLVPGIRQRRILGGERTGEDTEREHPQRPPTGLAHLLVAARRP